MRYFDYFWFDTLGETLEFLWKQRHTVKIVAGGTDLMIEIRKDSPKLSNMDKVLDISKIRELKLIDVDEKTVEIGSCVTHSKVAQDKEINNYFPALSKASLNVGCLQTRNQGTIGGNIVNCAPCADTVPALVAYDAKLELVKDGGEERVLSISDFVKWPYATVIKKEELLRSILIDKPAFENQKHVYTKLGRRNALSITRISVTAISDFVDGKIKDIRIVPGAVLSKPRKMEKAAEYLEGKEPSKEVFRKAAELVTEEVFEEVGERWSTPYKKPVLNNMVYASLCQMFDIEVK